MNIKEYIFKRKQRRYPQRTAVWPDWEQAKRVFILYDSDWMEKNTAIRDIQRCLIQDGKEVTVWGILPNKETTSPILPASRMIGRKQINLWDAPKKEILTSLAQESYDILLDLTQQDRLPARWLIRAIQAPFKAGLRKTEGLLDFMVDMPAEEDPTNLYQQIVRYMSMIRPV